MIDEHARPDWLLGRILLELANDAEALLLITSALESQAAGITSNACAQRLAECAALVKSAALQAGLAAARLVGSAERLRLVAACLADANTDNGELPS